MFTNSSFGAIRMPLFIPDTTASGGDTIVVSMMVGSTASIDSFLGVTIDIRFDRFLLEFLDVERTGTLLQAVDGFGVNPEYTTEASIQQARIVAYNTYNLYIGPDDILIRLRFRNKSYLPGTSADIELYSVALERSDVIITPTDTTFRPYFVPLTLTGGKIKTIEAKSSRLQAGNPAAEFDFSDGGGVHLVFSSASGTFDGKTITVTYLGRNNLFSSDSTVKNVSVYRLDSDLAEGQFSSVLRFYYTPAQLELAGIVDEKDLYLARYDETTAKWNVLQTSRNMELGFLYTTTDAFSYWKIVYDSTQSIVSVDGTINRQPEKFSLRQNYPNPFNLSTSIRFELTTDSNAELRIFDIAGREVRTLISTDLMGGEHVIIWDGRNSQGLICPSGVYLYRLRTRDYISVKKMVLVK